MEKPLQASKAFEENPDMTDFVFPIIASSSWAPIIQTLIGGLIGAAGAVAGGAFGAWFRGQQRRQSLAAALAASVAHQSERKQSKE